VFLCCCFFPLFFQFFLTFFLAINRLYKCPRFDMASMWDPKQQRLGMRQQEVNGIWDVSLMLFLFFFFSYFFFSRLSTDYRSTLCGISTTGDEAQREKKYDTVCFYVSFSFSFSFLFLFLFLFDIYHMIVGRQDGDTGRRFGLLIIFCRPTII
jgi:ABC-type methionine transport system permease subunit